MKKAIVLLLLMVLISCHHQKDNLDLKSKLSGKWTAKAFDGELHEEWSLNSDGWMQQKGHYIKNNDTTYSATSQIQKVGRQIILFSVIKNSNPKIFKSIYREDDKIIFENDDYKNPYQVIYEFISDQEYKRTITGKEKDSVVDYEFHFKKNK
ncbi:MAG: hypothetical protein ACPF88_07005 [Flavobacteriaceae bacterium]